MLNWVSKGFLIGLDLWCNLIFVCRIQCFAPFWSARQKFPFSSGFNDLCHSALFCFCAELSKLNHSALFCFCAVSSDLSQIALLDKRFRFSAEPRDLYQSSDLDKIFSFSLEFSDLFRSALRGKSFPFSARSSDFYHIALLDKTCFFMAGSICAWFFFSFLYVVLSDYETYVLSLPFVFQELTNWSNNIYIEYNILHLYSGIVFYNFH